MGNTVKQNSSINPNAPVAASKGMWAVKFCSNKILILASGCHLTQIDVYDGQKIVVAVAVRLLYHISLQEE